MKIPWTSLLATFALYAGVVGALRIADSFDYKGGANDIGNGLLVFAISVIVVGFFFIRSIVQAVSISPGYWLVVGLHLVLMALFILFFMI